MKQVIAILLTLLILSTNMGFTFATHYCAGQAVKTSLLLGDGHLGCGMLDNETPCKKLSNISQLKAKDCCHNKYTQFSIEDDFIISVDKHSSPVFQFDSEEVVSYFNLYKFCDESLTCNSNYVPPWLNKDIPLLIQTFLI